MPKILLYIAAAALVGFILTQRFIEPVTWQPFVDACLSGGTGTRAQCECLANYAHERLTVDEIRAIMENRRVSRAFEEKVANIIRAGANSCR